ncbi:carbohydrate ABC transporter permease [Microbacterium lacticum]
MPRRHPDPPRRACGRPPYRGSTLRRTPGIPASPGTPLSILVPLYSLLNTLGLLNSYAGLILPLACLELPRAIFLYTQFLRAVPISLEEAARVDGASRLQTLRMIVFPLLKPVTVTVIILTAVYVWNEFALSSYIITSTDMRTLAPAIAAFLGANGSNVNAAVAAALIGVVPMLIAYLFLQRYFMKGMLAGAEKVRIRRPQRTAAGGAAVVPPARRRYAGTGGTSLPPP